MARREIEFYSDGLRLSATLYTPDGAAGPVPAVVLCQGFGSGRELNGQPELAGVLAAAGVATLLFDHRGIGQSEGVRGRLIPLEQVQDIRDAVNFLSGEPGIDPDRLALAGSSFGAANAIVAGATHDAVRVVTALMPFGDGRRWMQLLRRYWEWRAFADRVRADRLRRVRDGRSEAVISGEILVRDPAGDRYAQEMASRYPSRRVEVPLEVADRLLEYAPEAYVGRIAPRPLLLIHGAEDTLIPVGESQRLLALAGDSCRLVIVPGVGHYDFYTGAPFERYTSEVVAFLQQHLLQRDAWARRTSLSQSEVPVEPRRCQQ